MSSTEGPSASFRDAVAPLLHLIDTDLGNRGIGLPDRVDRAAIFLVSEFIPKISIGGVNKAPGSVVEFTQASWFKPLHGHVEHWYKLRYRDRLRGKPDSASRGIVVVASTPFEISVPITRSRVEVVGEKAWLSFPNEVFPDEDPLSWILAAPDWSTYPADVQETASARALTIAGHLRAIFCRVTGADVQDTSARSLIAGIRVHLHSACSLIMREGEEGSYARAQWELQMSCESALKGLAQQKNGTFSKIHDLEVLCREAGVLGSTVQREWLQKLPRWKDAANLRYGIGDHPSIQDLFEWYATTLQILSGISSQIVQGQDLSKLSLLLNIAPWLRSDMGDANTSEAPGAAL